MEWISLYPKKQLEALRKAKLDKANERVIKEFGGWDKGVVTEITPGGHWTIGGTPLGGSGFFRQEYPGGWDLETLKKAMGEIENNKPPEPETDPVDDWANKWAQENEEKA